MTLKTVESSLRRTNRAQIERTVRSLAYSHNLFPFGGHLQWTTPW